MHEARVNVDGRATRYLEAGAGRPLILLHPFPMSADAWRPQFDRVPDGWRFLAPDLRGFGDPSASATPALTMDEHARDVLALMDVWRIERAVVGGLSMGGYIAFALFRLAPERIEALVLADTRPQPDSLDGRKARQALLELLHHKGIGAVADDMLPKLLGETTRRERPLVVAQVRKLIEASTPEAIDAAVHALMSRPDSTPDLARIRCPALVIVGEEDTVTPPADARALHAGIDGATLAVLAHAGHLSNLEMPDEFTNALSRFLATL
jgi:pimeloyl-ACP methyl ester carboxylesterase